MSHEEIDVSVSGAKAGNQQEVLKILELFKPLIVKAAKQYNIKGFDYCDLLQIGYTAVISALSKYDEGSHTFIAYICNSIDNAFKYTARQNVRFGEALSLNIPLNSENNTRTEFIDFIEDEENLEEELLNSESLKAVRASVAKLPAEEMGLVIMIYYLGASLKNYADYKQLDYFVARRKRNKILKKLKYFSDSL